MCCHYERIVYLMLIKQIRCRSYTKKVTGEKDFRQTMQQSPSVTRRKTKKSSKASRAVRNKGKVFIFAGELLISVETACK